ncbi:MAG TPA: GMC family oxidoreductase [Xanthobacteraceae bacterium]|nr:GMC family oxidoreductase [Xanthobacteraceae bacterium]
MATQEKVDVVIVGAGASGSVFAAVLAKAGKKVVVMDNGPDWHTSDLISSDIWGRRVKPAGAPFILEGKHPVSMGAQGGWGVGGAALHYFANFPRLLPNDFRIRSEHNRAHDWPISYEDVAPFYDKVAQEIGVSGDAAAEELWRPKGQRYPMPPMKTFRSGQVWLKGFAANGIRMVPAAVGMNSTEFKGRAACIYDGWCHVGCPIGALANPLVTYLADARKAGAEVRAWSTVTRVLTDTSGGKVTGVEYYDRNHEKQFQPANVVVLAAWAAQNPRLLLNSATDKHDKGLANRNGLVGKFIMTHFASGTNAMFDEDVENHMGTLGAQFMSYERYGKTAHKGAFGSTFIVAGSSTKLSGLGGIANARPDLFGAELQAFVKRAVKNLSRMNAFGEEQPKIENRLELASEKDEFGMPLGRIIHSYDDNDTALWNANFEEGLKIAKATDAKEVWQGRAVQPTIHLMGGTIMGTGAANSVVDSFGQTHEIANLYCAGPGTFATAGASNPTYTIFALSLRGAEHLAKNWSTVAG